MDLIENWTHIFEQHDEVAIFPFLKGLTATQKKDLLISISKTAKTYLELKDRLINGKYFYIKKASRKQERILNYTLLVTIPNRHHASCKWLNMKVIVTKIVVDNILNWYCPIWFSDYLNESDKLDYMAIPFSYDLVLEMSEKNYAQPSEQLLAKLLVRHIYDKIPNRKGVYHFQPANLGQYEFTVKKHFWYLFKYRTRIHSSNGCHPLEIDNKQEKDTWHITIKKYVDTKEIDQVRLLKACLLAMNKPIFNKLEISWFANLFEFLAPEETALLAVQKELFTSYKPTNTKATNTALKAIQKIVDSPSFQVENALVYFDKLMASNSKTIFLSIINLLEKLAKVDIEKRAVLCEIAIKSFVNRSIDIQHKAAKFIRKYGQPYRKKINPLLLPYKRNLLPSTQTILNDFIKIKKEGIFVKKVDNQVVKMGFVARLAKQNEMPSVNNFDQFLALALQVFDNNAAYHFDQFLAYLLVFQKAIKGGGIGRLLPLFKRAYQLVFNELPSNHGMLDNMLATFLLDYSDLLICRYPKDSLGLQALAKTYLEQGFHINDPNVPFDLNYTHLNRWYNPYDPSQVYTPIKLLLEQVLMLLQQERAQPLLSTPTHSPSWINPLDLIEKLAFYQENQIVPNTIDLQIAISRMAFEGQSAALQLANKKLKGHYLSLISYLLTPKSDFSQAESSSVASKETYERLVASITKNSVFPTEKEKIIPAIDLPSTLFTGNHKWMIFWEERQLEEWNHITQKHELAGKSFVHRELQVKTPKDLNFEAHPNFLYQYFPGSPEAFRPNLNDLERLLGLLPNNPSPLMMLLVADNLKYPTFLEVISKKRVEEMINWLSGQTNLNFTPPIHLFLATAMLCAEKKIRIKAGEIWQNAVSRNQLGAKDFGKILGRLENKEFAPLKRFTDLAQDHLLNISAVHNAALEKTIANLLSKLPPIPIKHTKQLLTLYRELLTANESTIQNERLLVLLVLWKESPNLRKVLKTLKEFVA